MYVIANPVWHTEDSKEIFDGRATKILQRYLEERPYVPTDGLL
jgi:hypothetical protein